MNDNETIADDDAPPAFGREDDFTRRLEALGADMVRDELIPTAIRCRRLSLTDEYEDDAGKPCVDEHDVYEVRVAGDGSARHVTFEAETIEAIADFEVMHGWLADEIDSLFKPQRSP